jgi:subtilisin family serine protease
VQRDRIEELFYGRPDQQRRFTQDFPILPDVWIAYGRSPADRIELLLSPHNESDAATAATALRQRLEHDRTAAGGLWQAAHPGMRAPRVLFNESVVLSGLSFWELLRGALPLTDWWKRAIAPLGDDWSRSRLTELAARLNDSRTGGTPLTIGTDPRLLVKLIRIAACIESEREGQPIPEIAVDQPALTPAEIEAFARLFEDLMQPDPSAAGILWSASLNRQASTGVWRSRLTVKADAAARLFDAKTAGIRWAVLDTGIDARHPAFKRRDASGAIRAVDPTAAPDDALNSRVVKTYDFLRIKELLDPDAPLGPAGADADARGLQPIREELARSLKMGRAVDWTLLEPLLRIPQSESGYKPPQYDSHGTHVAGILAANWPEAAQQTPIQEPLYGVCPDLEFYDLRVLPDNPSDTADEFTIMAALQFIRHLNANKDVMLIHGVNLSLSVPHDVANYACGRTPVCEECERVVASGVVVVTAAGNRGFDKRERDPSAFGDYRYISITDPGNADGVITVGSTHRMLPHNYGVSYFSSRGPTGDGRRKPDLVAPGERIDSCALNDYFGTMDGTSMAAPHVSGAAALLLARHRELIGNPRRVKDILARTATDLGREPRFQGAGMVDVLRAIQSI